MKKTIFLAMSSFIIQASVATAGETRWKGEITLESFDCKVVGSDALLISGSVILKHSEDSDPYGQIQEIGIDCPQLIFEAESSIRTISNLDIRISKVTAGPVRIINTRGIDGADAEPTPDIWEHHKMSDGENRPPAPNGRNASGCAWINDKSAHSGGHGRQGGHGKSGKLFEAPKGADGRPGANGGDITLISRSFAVGTTIEIISEGGDGGSGGLGGRGADGGIGGKGGDGGKGGNANDCHGSRRGGNGGDGGDGGSGGNGGPGGNGGDGGNGGTVTAALKEGEGVAPTPIIKNSGGRGGDPGLGGEAGLGGDGGNGGDWGLGGKGNDGLFGDLVDPKPASKGGNGGDPGKRGDNGEPGPLGIRGFNGQNGRIGDGFVGTLPSNVIDRLINNGSGS